MNKNMESYIRQYNNIIDPESCSFIIQCFENDPEGQYKGMLLQRYDPEVKECTDLHLTDRARIKKELWGNADEIIFKAVHDTFTQYCIDLDIAQYHSGSFLDTEYQMQKYIKNVGYFTQHIDTSNRMTACRFVAAIIYLNTVKEGGETYFKELDKKINCKVGSIVWFPTAFTHVHEGLVPISNDKYIITTFMEYGFVE